MLNIDQMKTINTPLLLISLICLTAATCSPFEDKVIATKSMKMKYNIVGIVGETSDAPYIEVQYVKDDGYGQNVTERKMVSPPFVFGGHLVNVRYDSIVGYYGNRAESYNLELRNDYNVNGADYLRIINHSEDKTIEYFMAGTQDVRTRGECNGLGFRDVVPSVCYRKAPIYYLLFPEEKYTENLSESDHNCDEILYFEGDRCGDLKLTTAWDVNDVAKLYRAEFNKSKDTALYLLHENTYFNGDRLSKLLERNSSNPRTYPYMKGKSLYGTVAPKNKLEGNEDIWLIATPVMFNKTFKWEEL